MTKRFRRANEKVLFKKKIKFWVQKEDGQGLSLSSHLFFLLDFLQTFYQNLILWRNKKWQKNLKSML